MKKISLLTKIIFHVSNIGLIFLYLFPGSILGWLMYGDFQNNHKYLLIFSYHQTMFMHLFF